MVKLIETVYNFLWGDLLTAPLPGGGTLPLSLLVILLIPTGVYFTIRTKFLPIRLFKDMVGALFEKKDEEQSALSVIQTLIVSTATRVGMGNLVGVVAAISAGGAGAVFWMWVTALIGSSTLLSKQLYHRFIKKKTLYMEDIEEDLLTTFIDILKKNPARKNVMYFFPYSLPFPALYAGAASVR